MLGLSQGQVFRDSNCVVDAEIWSLPACALETRDGRLYLKGQFLPLYHFEKPYGLAWSHLPQDGWAYFNRQGLVVVKNVATMDNGPDEFHSGLVRVTQGGKWGLANSKGTFIVPLAYDGILGYKPGFGWKACIGCRTISDGEYHRFDGGKWIQISPLGKIAK